VDPPVPVAGCEESGICVIAVHCPHINITQGTATVAEVCGAAAAAGSGRCVVAVGDWNAPVAHRPPPITNSTVRERLSQLLGWSELELELTASAPDVNTCCYPTTKYLGIDDHVATNIAGATVVASHVYPFQLASFSNDTEEHKAIAVTLGLPPCPSL
jgi:hypothetical protein